MQVLQATLFPSLTTTTGRALDWSWPTFCTLLADPPAPWQASERTALPLVKLGRFKDNSRAAESPLIQISGIEGDYDAGETSPEDAVALLTAAGIECAVVTTARHAPQAPRWRVFAPLSIATQPEVRAKLLARLNGALGGILAPESFTPKQTYFVGRLRTAPHYRCYVVEGQPIDLLAALDAGAKWPPAKGAHNAPEADEGHGMRLAGNASRWDDNRDELLGALAAVDPDCTYKVWMEVSASLYFASGGKALIDWLQWSARSTKFPGDEAASAKWRDFGHMHQFSVGTLYHYAQEAGWVRGLDRAAVPAPPGEPERHCTPIVDLAHCLKHWVWLSGSSSVLMRERNGYILKWQAVLLTYVASTMAPLDTSTRLPQGKRRFPVPVAWHALKDRIEVEEVTYMPGMPLFCNNPVGAKSFNMWQPIARHKPRNMGVVQTFLQHVEYLVPMAEQREQFLLWLAHAEQCPQQLPMAHWLMITKAQGIGRNWLSALLARLWPQQVALGVDLPHIFQSGFNDELSRKIFACVDEIDVGGGMAARSKFSTALKALLTAQQHTINIKYGPKVVETNCTRWLLLSNSEAAVPLSAGDRRLNVVRNPQIPRSAEYYTALYGRLEEPEFVAAVGYYLRTLDISAFNPGARALDSEMKRVVVSVGRDDVEACIDNFCAEWPSAIAPADMLRDYVMQHTGLHRDKLRYMSRALQFTSAEQLADRLLLPGDKRVTAIITRDADTWRNASHGDRTAECTRGMAEWQTMKFGPV